MTESPQFLRRLSPHLFPSTTRRRKNPHCNGLQQEPVSHEATAPDRSHSSSGFSVAPRSSLSSLDHRDAIPGKGAAGVTHSKNVYCLASSESEDTPLFREGEGNSSADDWAESEVRRSRLPSDSSTGLYNFRVPRSRQPMIIRGQTNEDLNTGPVSADVATEISNRVDRQQLGVELDKLEVKMDEKLQRLKDEILAALSKQAPPPSPHYCCVQ